MNFLITDIQQKDIIFYKVGKFQKDVELFFEELNVCFYLEDDEDYSVETIRNKKVLKISESTKDDFKNKLIIICSFEPASSEDRLKDLGLIYGEDYIYGIDLINSISKSVPEGDIIVFGTGQTAQNRIGIYEALDVKYYIDNDSSKWGAIFNGKPVKSPLELMNEEKDSFLVIIASIYFDEMKSQLIELGAIDPNKIYSQEEWEGRFADYEISRLLLYTIKAPVLFDYICINSFVFFQIIPDGNVCVCTPASRKFFLGNIRHNSFDQIINSSLARLIRLSVINGTYCFCTDTCSYNRHTTKLVGFDRRNTENKYTSLNIDRCASVAINYDPCCNLTCPSCRNTPLILSENQKCIRETIHNKVIKEVLPKTDTLYVAGNGDPFFSKYYSELIYDKYKGERLRIQTNGMLFTEKNWQKLKGKYKKLSLEVSIDAATEETYKYVRRGGDFTILMENMELAKNLRASNDITHLRISFVVQACNFKEMERFVEMGIYLGADMISFGPIYNWTGLPEEEFEKLNLLDENNQYHYEFVEMLKKPIFRHPKVSSSFALKGIL